MQTLTTLVYVAHQLLSYVYMLQVFVTYTIIKSIMLLQDTQIVSFLQQSNYNNIKYLVLNLHSVIGQTIVENNERAKIGVLQIFRFTRFILV